MLARGLFLQKEGAFVDVRQGAQRRICGVFCLRGCASAWAGVGGW